MGAMVTKGGTYALCLNAGPEPSPTTAAPAVTPPQQGSTGFSKDIVVPAILLMIVVIGVVVYLISTRTSNGDSPPKDEK